MRQTITFALIWGIASIAQAGTLTIDGSWLTGSIRGAITLDAQGMIDINYDAPIGPDSDRLVMKPDPDMPWTFAPLMAYEDGIGDYHDTSNDLREIVGYWKSIDDYDLHGSLRQSEYIDRWASFQMTPGTATLTAVGRSWSGPTYLSMALVPEPAAFVLLLVGLATTLAYSRKRGE